MKTKIIIAVGVLLAVALFFIFAATNTSGFENVKNAGGIKIYKSMSCGCCSVYSEYFKSKGNPNVQILNVDDIESSKKELGVPEAMKSCHTTMVGSYFVEGHVPLEAVEKLLLEKPNIKGIAMPGMPNGSPGMPGAKIGDFIVYAVNNDGSYEEFMRI